MLPIPARLDPVMEQCYKRIIPSYTQDNYVEFKYSIPEPPNDQNYVKSVLGKSKPLPAGEVENVLVSCITLDPSIKVELTLAVI